MGNPPSDDRGGVEEAVGLLEEFGFTEYEAKCFVALLRIDRGTAKEVSDVADVPRARVYDSMESLQDRGLVEVQASSPRRFRAADPEEAVGALERRYTERLDRLETLFADLGPPEAREEEGDVWVMEGDEAVGDRMVGLLEEATDEVLFAAADEDLLTEDLLSALSAAADRGVAVTAGSPGEPVRERIADAVPDATVVETWTWWEEYPIRAGAVSSVLMVDGDALLTSTDAPTTLPGVRTHRAVWTDSEAAPLVGVMRPLLAEAIVGPEGATA
ncbi:MAG: TrmB family transcriptional regulator [Halobacteriaceae archaeon]